MSESGIVKVADFGTSKLISHLRNEPVRRGTGAGAEEKVSVLTVGVGTLLWTAPEVHNSGHYSLPADVYSFAIVMWECVERRLPFEEHKTVWAVRNAVLDGQRPPVGPLVPGAFAELMVQCWDAAPERRPTFEVIVETLDALGVSKETET